MITIHISAWQFWVFLGVSVIAALPKLAESFKHTAKAFKEARAEWKNAKEEKESW